jgi:hypothetical protein
VWFLLPRDWGVFFRTNSHYFLKAAMDADIPFTPPLLPSCNLMVVV